MSLTKPPHSEITKLIGLYNSRNYAELESRARALLIRYSDSGYVWQLLAGALQMQGKNALSSFKKAAELMPEDAGAHFNLGIAQKKLGQLEDAVASYRRALEIKPDYAEAFSNLGNVFKDLGKNDEALENYRRAFEIKPDYAEAHNNLGTILKILGQPKDAMASYRRALDIKPNFADAHFNLGNAYKDLGQFEDAVASYRTSVKLKPDFADAYSNLGAALKELGHFESAMNNHRLAVELKPGSAEAHNNLGTAFKDLGKLEEATACYRRAIDINPNYASAHFNLGNAMQEMGQFESAADCFRQALRLNPDLHDAYTSLGVVLKNLGQYEGAVDAYRWALELQPESAQAHYDFGNAIKYLGQHEAAVGCYRRALYIKPDFIDAQSNLLFTLNFISSNENFDCLSEARRYGRMITGQVTKRFTDWQCTAKPERLRVGLVSGDLHNHPVGHFLEGLLSHIDPSRVELIAYHTNRKEDELTARIRPYFSAWKSLVGLGDQAAARLIHADAVHILLDLSGHTGHNRLPVFAWKPAPVQVTWLGYFATTGVAEIDYVLADEVGVPEAQRQQFTESVWYLPDTRLCFTAPGVDLPVAPLPASSNGMITFGCFQHLSKVSDEVLTVWGKIFAALPEARLRIQCVQFKDPSVLAKFIENIQRHGIDPNRVTTHSGVARASYLSAHAEVDIKLDTFPYPGGTTTCEALWMGVPTLTLAGDSLLARQGASLLTAAELEEWIATSKDDYIAKAITLADDLQKLAALRKGLRKQVLSSPLFDAPRFARNFENALWGMWQRHQTET